MDPEKKSARFISKKLNIENIFIVITILLVVIIIINIILTFNINSNLKKSAQAAMEKLKPAKIELALIKNSKCSDCFDISTIVGHIRNVKLNVTKETAYEFDSAKGKELINKYAAFCGGRAVVQRPYCGISGGFGSISMREKSER